MNQDVRQDHTMRNALLLVSGVAGAAAGGVAGIKALEKNAGKIAKAATGSVEKEAAKDVAKASKSTVKNKIKNTPKSSLDDLSGGSKDIKTKPETTSPKSKVSVSDRLLKLEEYEKKVEKQIKDTSVVAEKKKLIETLSFIKAEIAKLRGF